MQINWKKSTARFLLFPKKFWSNNFWAKSGDRNSDDSEKTQLKHQRDVFFTKTFVGSSNLHTSKIWFFNSSRNLVMDVGVGWARSHLSPLDQPFCTLRPTCAILMKLCSRDQSLLTNILSYNPPFEVNFKHAQMVHF